MAPGRGEGLEFFERRIAKYGKPRYLRERVLQAAREAGEGDLTPFAMGFLNGHREEFIKRFDALEKEGLPEGVLELIEAAFHIGEAMAAVRCRKEVPAIQTENGRGSNRKRAAELRTVLRKAILECVDGDPTRLASPEGKIRPARKEVLARLQKEDLSALKPSEEWPPESTIRDEIRNIKKEHKKVKI